MHSVIDDQWFQQFLNNELVDYRFSCEFDLYMYIESPEKPVSQVEGGKQKRSLGIPHCTTRFPRWTGKPGEQMPFQLLNLNLLSFRSLESLYLELL